MYQKLHLYCPVKTKAHMKLTVHCLAILSNANTCTLDPVCITTPSIPIPVLFDPHYFLLSLDKPSSSPLVCQ